MFKRIWIVLVVVLAIGVLLSACGGGDLAEDLTPIPTLPLGEEPALRAELQAADVAAPADDAAAGGAQLDEATLLMMGGDLFVSLCVSCHGPEDDAGPAFPGMAERAATRIEGMSAEDYLYEAIVSPGVYVVEGFPNFMPANYGTDLSNEELQALVTYIMMESGVPADEPAGGDAAGDDADADVTVADDAVGDNAAAPDAADGDADAAPVVGDAANGKTIFAQACANCHGPEDSLGPALTGMGARAATRVEGLTAEEYLYDAIVNPADNMVDGFANIMPPGYGDTYTDQELHDIIAYILTQ